MSLRTLNALLAMGFILLAAYVLGEVQSFADPRAAEFPRLVSGVFVFVGVVLLASNWRKSSGAAAAHVYPFEGVPWLLWFGVVFTFVLFGLGAATIGFYESAFLFLAVGTWILSAGEPHSPRRYLMPLVFAFAADAFLYVTFGLILRIPTPPGIFISV